MSLIGPRPERPAFCAEFEKRIHGWHYRTMVTPGLSGLAQVTGGYDLLPKEKVVLDLWSRFLGRKNKLLQASSRSRSYGALWTTDVLILRLCCSRADAFEHVLLRLLPRLAALAVHQLALERLEEGLRERVVPQVARP